MKGHSGVNTSQNYFSVENIFLPLVTCMPLKYPDYEFVNKLTIIIRNNVPLDGIIHTLYSLFTLVNKG